MKILIIPDSFKGSMSSIEACVAIQEGIVLVDRAISTQVCPLSDGGEGSLAILQFLGKGHTIQTASEDPVGKPIISVYVIDQTGTAGWIELSEASGLWRTELSLRNPMQASTYGTGLLLKDAMERGCTDLVLSVGGSATHDLGFGIAQALGVEFYDHNGSMGRMTGETLGAVERISTERLDPRIRDGVVTLTVLYDVNNPLTGVEGAARMYGAQKGANPTQIASLEENTLHVASLCQKLTPSTNPSMNPFDPGMGASGGVPFGLKALLGARVSSGFDRFNSLMNYEQAVQESDLIITGEGSLDAQSVHGKGPGNILNFAHHYKKPSIALGGKVQDLDVLQDHYPTTQFVSIMPPSMTIQESMSHGVDLLRDATTKALKTYIKSYGA